MNSLYEGFISDLKSKYSLNDRDIMFIILLKLGFSTTEIASVFEYEENTIYKKKQRLRSRLKQSGNEYLNDILK
jgi:transposase